MAALGLMGFKSHYQVSKTLTGDELPEHQCKKLVPARQMLDITVSIAPLKLLVKDFISAISKND